jgi:hypothetical protein
MANGKRTGAQKGESQCSRLRLAKGRIHLRKHAGPLRDSGKGNKDFELRHKKLDVPVIERAQRTARAWTPVARFLKNKPELSTLRAQK